MAVFWDDELTGEPYEPPPPLTLWEAVCDVGTAFRQLGMVIRERMRKMIKWQ